MLSQKAAMFLLIQIHILQAISQTINTRDTRVFEIALDDVNYDEESENEMIQSVDLADLKPLAEDESRYEPLHSHVKYYNEHNAESKKQYSDILLSLQPHTKEMFNLEEKDKFVAGFKHNLDKYFPKTAKQIIAVSSINHTNKNKKSMQTSARLQNYRKNRANVATVKSVKSIRVKRKENHYETTMNKKTDFSQVMKNRNVTTDKTETTEYFMKTQRTQYDLYEYKETMNKDIKDTLDQILILEKGVTSPIDNESSYNESYDYERFKMEYEHQLEYDIKEGKVLNYTETEESNNTPKKALKRIMNLKQPENCTKEELSQIGIKAIECLLYDYQRMKDITTAKVVLSRTWLVLRIWIFIYICLAILCWCQRGWCCCCFRCKFCFPRKRIILVKQYYTMNPPGVFMKDFKKKKDVKKEEPIRYGATKYEYDAYKTLETAIRNI